MPPRLIIVAGANGSGKSTFAAPYVAELGIPFLNAGEANALVKAGRAFFGQLRGARTGGGGERGDGDDAKRDVH